MEAATTDPVPPEDSAALLRRLHRLEQLTRTQALLTETDFDLDAFLQIAADRLGEIVGAKAVVIELAEDRQMVHRASSGDLARHRGWRTTREGTFSGEVMAGGRLIYCRDVETDPHINREACRRNGVRSIIGAPLFENAAAVGVVKIMSAEIDGFGEAEIEALGLMAEAVGGALAKQLSFQANQRLLEERTRALAIFEQEVIQRRRLEASLRASESRIQNVITHAHQAIVTTDEAGLIVDWNHHAELTFGWTSQEAVGRPMAELVIPPEHRDEHSRGVARFIAHGEPVLVGRRVELQAVHRTGARFPIECAVSAVQGPDGWEFTALIQDITERKAQFEVFENAFHHAAIGMALIGLDGRFMRVNDSFSSLIGYAPHEVLDLDFQSITHPDDLDADLEQLERLIAGDISSYRMDKRYFRKDGSVLWAHLSVSMVTDAAARPGYFISQIQDLTAQREAEGRYRLVAENASDMITLLGLGAEYLYVSPSAARVLGYEPDAMLGRSVFDFLAMGEMAALDHARERLAQEPPGVPVQHLLRMRRSDGELIWVEAVARLTYDHHGKPVVVSVGRDVTSRIQAREAARRQADKLAVLSQQLASARDAAETANRAKSDFLAGMSHELRTPLNGIIGFAELLSQDGLSDAQRREFSGFMRDAGRSLLTIVNDILDFSKIEAGKLELESTAVDIGQLVRGCEALVRHDAEAKGLALEVHIDPLLPPAMTGDPTRLRQILVNLAVNAVKFTDTGAVCVDVRQVVRDGATLIRFEVADTGIGIAPDAQGRLFQHFHQVDPSTTRKYGGTGLGLAICKRLVDMMGGALGLDSSLGQGSTFWFETPLLAAPAPASAGRATAPQTGRRLNILLAEDMEMNQVLVATILRRAGHGVELVGDGAEAVAAVQTRPFDLVLMDVHMPVMDGLEAARLIRALPGAAGRTPILAMTANVMAEDIAECGAAGMDGHLAKPIDAGKLVARVAAVGQAGRDDTPPPAGAVLNAETVGRMEQLLGAEMLADLAAELVRDVSGALAAMQAAPDDRQLIEKAAHDLVSLAGNLGFERLSASSRTLMQACQRGGAPAPALAVVAAEVSAALAQARARWPA
jgi:PAS domain S-box-containing protein